MYSEGIEDMDRYDKAVRVFVGGRDWYYQPKCVVGENRPVVSLYDGDGIFLKDFQNTNDMTEWLLKKSNTNKVKKKEKVQEMFMRRFEELRGESTDADFAVRVGLKPATVYQYLTGRRFPTVVALMQIADRCGVTVDWLIGRGGNDNGV